MRSPLAEEMVRGALAAFGGAHGCVVSVRGRLTRHRATGSVRAICGLGQLRHSSSARGERRSEMNKRLSFLLVLSATALAWSGCDNNGPTDGGTGCTDGSICFDDAGGGGDDAGPMADSGPMDDGGGGGGAIVPGRRQRRWHVRRGSMCGSDLQCFSETIMGSSGALTLRTAFGIPSVMPDPSNPGGYVSSTTDVPIWVRARRAVQPGMCSAHRKHCGFLPGLLHVHHEPGRVAVLLVGWPDRAVLRRQHVHE